MKPLASSALALVGALALGAASMTPSMAQTPAPQPPTPSTPAPAPSTPAPSTPAPKPTAPPVFTKTVVKALEGKGECVTTAFTDAGYLSATCDGIGYVLKDGQPVTLKTDTPEYTINAYHVQVGNADGMLAGPGKCTAKKEGSVAEMCLIRWDVDGKPSVIMPKAIGGLDVQGASASVMNSRGDVVYLELEKNNMFGYFTSRVWWADGATEEIKPSIPYAGILVNGMSTYGIAVGNQLPNPGGDDSTPEPAPTSAPAPAPTSAPAPAPTNAPAPAPTSAPAKPRTRIVMPALIDGITASMQDIRAAVLKARQGGGVQAFMWARSGAAVKPLLGIHGKTEQNRLLAGSSNGRFWVGATDSDVEDQHGTPAIFNPFGKADALPSVPGATYWEPTHVNNQGTILGDIYPKAGEDYTLIPVLVQQDGKSTRIDSTTLEGVTEKAYVSLSHLDNQGRLFGTVYDEGKTSVVIITAKR